MIKRSYHSKSREKGEAEVLLFLTALLICGLISGSLWLLGWVRQTKHARVDRHVIALNARNQQAPFVPRLDPGEFYATCEKKLWAPLSREVSCEVLPESYRELEIER
jgi:hypothetical protein